MFKMRKHIPAIVALAAAAACLGALFSGDAKADVTVGLHLVSVHVPAEDYLHGVNPGIYARWDNGVTVGAYRNSFERPSYYAGYTYEYGPAAITIGGITGYQIKRGPCTASQSQYAWCEYGNSKGAIGPLLAPSVRLPAVFDVVPRVTLLPKFTAKGHTVLHLSIERRF